MPLKLKKALGFMAATLAFVMAVLDTTIVNIACPDIMKDLNSSVSTISWLLNAYNMAFAILLLSFARLADQFGRKRIFLIGVVLFTLSSLACGLSSDISVLIALRVLQGAGAAILVPVSIPILLSLFSKAHQTTVIAVWGASSALASACGPVIGGLLTDYGSWHMIFFVNVPFGAAAFVLTLLFVRETRDPSVPKTIDWTGMFALSVAVAACTFYLIKGNDEGWMSGGMLVLPAVGLIATTVFLWVESRSLAPMLTFNLFKFQPFRIANIVILIIGIVINAVMFVASLYLVRLRGLSVLHAGELLSALPIGTMLTSVACSRLIKRISPAVLTAAATCIIGGAALLMSAMTAATPYAHIAAMFFFSGLGFGINLPVIMNLLIDGVPGGNIGMASGLGNMARTLGSIIGVALIVAVLTGTMTDRLSSMKQEALQKVDQSAVLLPSVKRGLKSNLRKMKTGSAAGSSVTSSVALHRAINRQLSSAEHARSKAIDTTIDRLIVQKEASAATLLDQKIQSVQQLPTSPARAAALQRLQQEQHMLASESTKKKKMLKEAALQSLKQKLIIQHRALSLFVDWFAQHIKQESAAAFRTAFITIACLNFAVLLFCPFLRRSGRAKATI
ncbi:MAG: MFS transporter [Sporolactobacillus sp.]